MILKKIFSKFKMSFIIYTLIEEKVDFEEKQRDDTFVFVLSKNKSIVVNEAEFKNIIEKPFSFTNENYDDNHTYICRFKFYKLGDIWVDFSFATAYYEMVICNGDNIIQLVPKGTFYPEPENCVEYYAIFDCQRIDYASHWPSKKNDLKGKD